MKTHMNKVSPFLIIIIIFQILIGQVHAAFLLEKQFATRSRGMGGAFTAVSDDTGALVYNTAGLGFIDWVEMNFMYSKLFAGLDGVDMGLSYLGVLYPLRKMTFGLHWSRFFTTNLYFENSFQFAGGLLVSNDLSVGMGLNYLGHSYVTSDDARLKDDPVFASGDKKYSLGLNMGALYKKEKISFGISGTNINKPDIGLKTEDKVPPEYRIGAAFHTQRVTIPFDVYYRDQEYLTSSDKTGLATGVEWRITEEIAGRMGYHSFLGKGLSQGAEFTLGFSLYKNNVFDMWDMGIDYALAWPIGGVDDTLGSHQLAFTIRYGKAPISYDSLQTPSVSMEEYESAGDVSFLQKDIDSRIDIAKGITSGGFETAKLAIDGIHVLKLYAPIGEKGPYERVEDIARKLTKMMQTHEFHDEDFVLDEEEGLCYIVIKDEDIVLANYDADLMKVDSDMLANKWIEKFREALVREDNVRKGKSVKFGSRLVVKQEFSTLGEIGVLMDGKKEVLRLYVEVDGKSPYQRAQEIAKKLNKHLIVRVRSSSVYSGKLAGLMYIIVDNEPLVPADFDAVFMEMKPKKLAEIWTSALKKLFSKK